MSAAAAVVVVVVVGAVAVAVAAASAEIAAFGVSAACADAAGQRRRYPVEQWPVAQRAAAAARVARELADWWARRIYWSQTAASSRRAPGCDAL